MEQFSLTDIKKKNLSDVYHYIYMNPSCSKQDIATALSVSLPTVSQHLTTLESEQLIEKCGRLSSSVGRRANAYQIISDAKIAIPVVPCCICNLLFLSDLLNACKKFPVLDCFLEFQIFGCIQHLFFQFF